MARPTKFSKELGEEICERIATSSEGLRAICGRDENFPSVRTVYYWLTEREEFRAQYSLAREVQADLLAEEILLIADDASQDTVESARGPVANKEWLYRSRLRCEMRQWLAGKLRPKIYGNKTEVEMTPGDGLQEVLDSIRSGDGA